VLISLTGIKSEVYHRGMKKEIDEKKLVIPPYVSTLWKHVKALFLKEDHLVVELNDGEQVQIPGLNEADLEEIFSYHSAYLAKDEEVSETEPSSSGFSFDMGSGKDSPFDFSMNAMEGLSGSMKHNPSQSNLPELPPELLDKVAHIAKLLAPEEVEIVDPPVEGCNCVYCQVSRAISKPSVPETQEEIEVTEEDLRFSEWEIQEMEDKLFEVTNKLDKNEKYRVFLGDPIGCTCGRPNCEHIIAVLKS